MKYFTSQHLVPYTPQYMFDIVLDIEKYPQFITFCKNATILMRQENKLQADLQVGFGILNETYASMVNYQTHTFIQAECYTKPFKYMMNTWTFEPHPKGCLVKFTLEFEFKKSLFNIITNQVFLSISKEIMHDFIKRADALYG